MSNSLSRNSKVWDVLADRAVFSGKVKRIERLAHLVTWRSVTDCGSSTQGSANTACWCHHLILLYCLRAKPEHIHGLQDQTNAATNIITKLFSDQEIRKQFTLL
jgi:hypothetical protein